MLNPGEHGGPGHVFRERHRGFGSTKPQSALGTSASIPIELNLNADSAEKTSLSSGRPGADFTIA